VETFHFCNPPAANKRIEKSMTPAVENSSQNSLINFRMYISLHSGAATAFILTP